ncbi:hypothetical protein ACQR1Y_11595 [Bradyrhizobium sp. HKCCYLRH3099]|uniref:hypothetical protein n=1 Tax=unclassified Bradyrhizobium TaxID=2631580 RepID=UPI003EB9D5E1
MTRRDHHRLADRDRMRQFGTEGVRGGMTGPTSVYLDKPHQRPPQRDRATMRQECDEAFKVWSATRRST